MSVILERQETRGGEGDLRLECNGLADRGGQGTVEGRGGREKLGLGGRVCVDCVGRMDVEEVAGLLGNSRSRLFSL